jgi:ABC-type branched-subunit amino acid transport system substrate-binding protein
LKRTAVAVVSVLALLSAACGSRLSEQDREAIVSALTRARAGQQTVATGPVAAGPTTTAAPDEAGGDSDGAGDAPGGGPTTNGRPQENGTTPSGPAAKTCAKATKPSGTGVTTNKLTVATLADISGVQPGLFQSAHQAARAAAAYINSQGGICGRQLDPMLIDSKTDSGGNRAAMLDACQKAFAVVGSMSAFDDGSAAPGESCMIPDMSAIVVNARKYQTKNTFPISPAAAGTISTTAPKYIAKTFPNDVKKAAMLWLNQAVTKNNAAQRMKAYETVGFKWIYSTEVQVLEANYTRFVQEMRNRGVQYVNMVSDFQSVIRLQKSMRQQNYVPKVRDWDSVAYDPDYLTEREVVEGSLVFINTAMLEESANNAEMKLYLDWLQRASPGAKPDYFGIYAWSAYRLFQKLATQIGPDLTRPKLLAALKATSEWGATGLHAPHKIGAKQLSTCNLYLDVKGGRFVRRSPASGFDCSGTLVKAT